MAVACGKEDDLILIKDNTGLVFKMFPLNNGLKKIQKNCNSAQLYRHISAFCRGDTYITSEADKIRAGNRHRNVLHHLQEIPEQTPNSPHVVVVALIVFLYRKLLTWG